MPDAVSARPDEPPQQPVPAAPAPADPVVIRLPRTAYLAVLFLAVGCVPVAFAGGSGTDVRGAVNGDDTSSVLGPQLLVLLLPVLAALFIARTATFVSAQGLRVRAVFGSRTLPWPTVRGLQVRGRVVYAVQEDGIVRLPCVRLAHLGPISRLSGGYLPTLRDAVPKPARASRRRR